MMEYNYGALDEAGIVESDIEEVVREYSDSPEGWASEEVLMILKMKDGRWCHVEAWCDTTGWDCRAGAFTVFASSEEELLNEVTLTAKQLLGYPV